MCGCNKTLEQIQNKTNAIRTRKGLNPLPYVYVLKGWHGLIDGYVGKRNPYHSDGKVGNNYVFSAFKARKIAKKLSTMSYNGRSDSLGYQYWWREAA